VLVVYDLIFMDRLPLSRSLYQNVGRLYRRLVVPQAIKRADVIVTVSNYTAQQLVSRFAVDRSRIHVIPCSLGAAWFFTETARAATPHYVLAVAGEAPSKNLSRAIAAFARCRTLNQDLGLRLKVAGVKEKFHSLFEGEARKLGISGFVDFMSYIPEAEMQSLFQHAKVLIVPSLSEGFGIPVLEAMAVGLPVAASSSTCLQEIGGNAARYFDPYSIEDMAAALHEILTDSALQIRMSQLGRIQSRKYHPDVVGELVRTFWAELEGTEELTLYKEKVQ
jgi:glycosyltransferase involved in cell wall biosynthesis